MKNNSQIKYVNNAKLLNKREMKILDDAGLKKVYDFQDLPVIGLIQLNKLGFESAVDVLKLLHPYYKQKLIWIEKTIFDDRYPAFLIEEKICIKKERRMRSFFLYRKVLRTLL